MNKIVSILVFVIGISSLSGCAIHIEGMHDQPSDKTAIISTLNVTSGNLYISKINGTSTADAKRFLDFKLLYPKRVFLEPGGYSISYEHVGGGYQLLKGQMDVDIKNPGGYLLKNTINNGKMYFWIEDAGTGDWVAGWKS